MTDNGQRNRSRWERFKLWLFGWAHIETGPDKYMVEIHEGVIPRLRRLFTAVVKFFAAALKHPVIAAIVAGLVLTAIFTAARVLF